MKSVLKWVIWLYIAAACAYVFYEWYAYAGLYRLAAEWQLEHYGSYGLKLTLIVPLMVLLMPADRTRPQPQRGPAAVLRHRRGERNARLLHAGRCRSSGGAPAAS